MFQQSVNRVRFVAAVVSVGMWCATRTESVAAPIVIVTSAAWRVTGSQPASGWNTTMAFDDSAFGQASVNYPSEPMDGNVVNGIWNSSSHDGGSAETWFRYTFSLPSTPSSGLLDVAVDDDVDVYINGVQVVNDHNGTAQQILNVDVTSVLQQGSNLIAAHASNNGTYGPRSFHASLEVATVPEPSTWAMALAGMACGGYTVTRRRKRA